MDGTLLDDAGSLPAGFAELLADMDTAGMLLIPASGRQCTTLQHMFAPFPQVRTFIAENGSVVRHHGELIDSAALDPTAVTAVLKAATKAGYVAVRCHADCAYLEPTTDEVMAEISKYYRAHEVVDDVTAVAGDVVKLAIFDPDDAETGAYPLLQDVGKHLSVALSGKHWVDLMMPGRDKGTGVRAIQRSLGVSPQRTAVFGDYLNDLPMMGCGQYSYAMANAHPDIIAAANYQAPANTEAGVLRVLREWV
nr:HAD-IIB family hydrolase [Corynebacterium sp. TAE3-ERU12]